MRKLILSIVGLAGLVPMAAYSVPIVQTVACVDGANQCATGITGLETAGATFNVSFVTGSSYDDVYAAHDPYFLGDGAGASTAIDAIIDAFGGAVFGVLGEGFGDLTSRILVPSATASGGNSGALAVSDRGSSSWFAGTYGTDNATDFGAFEPDYFTGYAVFEAVSVPEPATLALFCLGLAGLGLSRRRKIVPA
jgi:PEP-CTERM motif